MIKFKKENWYDVLIYNNDISRDYVVAKLDKRKIYKITYNNGFKDLVRVMRQELIGVCCFSLSTSNYFIVQDFVKMYEQGKIKETKDIIYKFNELDKEIQEKLIEEEIEYQKEAYCECCLQEDMEEKAKELLKKYFKGKATFTDVYYSLGYSQGDGAMIAFTMDYYGKFVGVEHSMWCNYYHERSFAITSHDGNYLTDTQEEKLKEKIVKMNEELTKYGYELIEQEYDRAEIIDGLSENEYFANGEIC